MNADVTSGDGSLAGWRVLVPRTPEQAVATCVALKRHGARGEVVPTIAVLPPKNEAALQSAVRDLVTGEYGWISFTSVNAVHGLRRACERTGHGDLAQVVSGTRVASVGGVTQAALSELGVDSDLVPPRDFNARGMLAIWPPRSGHPEGSARVLLPRADIAPPTLPDGLAELGWEPHDVAAYRTVPASPPPPERVEAVRGGGFDAALFTSASTVRNLVELVGLPHPRTVVACIGPSSRKAAEDLGLKVAVEPRRATSDALVEALAEYGREHGRPR